MFDRSFDLKNIKLYNEDAWDMSEQFLLRNLKYDFRQFKDIGDEHLLGNPYKSFKEHLVRLIKYKMDNYLNQVFDEIES